LLTALICSIITQSIKGETYGSFSEYSAKLTGGTIAYFGTAAIFIFFVRGLRGAIIGVCIVCIMAFFGGYATYHDRNSPSQPVVPSPNPSATVVGKRIYPWNPPGSEYSCVFQGEPTFKDVETVINGNTVVCTTGEYLGDEGFERAEYLPYAATGHITKTAALARINDFATSFGMAHFDVAFDDGNPNDITATMRASKTIDTQYGGVIMNFYAVLHWGRKTLFTQFIGEAAKTYPSREGQTFLSSIHQQGQ